MNDLFNSNIYNIVNTNKSQSKEKKLNVFTVFSNIGSNLNRFSSGNQKNLTNFNSQKKMKKESTKHKPNTEIKNNDEKLVGFNGNNLNNIKIKNYSNLIAKASKGVKNKNKSHYLSKPKLEIEVNNRNNRNNISTNYSKISKNKKYKKNISEHDLVNNILNTFSNCNPQKGVNIKLNFTSKKKLNTDKTNKNKTKTKSSAKARHSSDTKLLRSSSGYSHINSKISQTNSFFSGNNNKMGYVSTCGNNPDWTTKNFTNIMKGSSKKNTNSKHNNNNNHNNKYSKSPVIGKIIKNYKNNDLKCIFNMNLIPPVSPINNIQEYFKNLYKVEYNNDYKIKKIKNKNRKERESTGEKNKEKDEKKTNNDDYTNSKNTMTKTNDISKIKKDKDSINIIKYCNDTPEEIHFYIISYIQNGKNMEYNLNKK